MLNIGLSIMGQLYSGSSLFSVAFTGLTDGEARIGDHASIGYTTDPVSATETVKWSNSSDPAAAATYGTGASPTDYTAGDEGSLWLHVTDGGDTVSRSAPIRYAPGTASAIADGQTATVDDTALSIAGTASGANLTFTYSLLNAPAGMTTNASTGGIGGTVTEVFSGTVTLRATDQYGRTLDDTFTFTSSLRAQATAAGALADQSFTNNTGVETFATAGDFTANGNTLTYSVNSVSGVSINSSTGVVSFDTTAMSVQAGTSIVVTATDEYARTTTTAFSVDITAAGAANVTGNSPSVPDQPQWTVDDTAISIDGSATNTVVTYTPLFAEDFTSYGSDTDWTTDTDIAEEVDINSDHVATVRAATNLLELSKSGNFGDAFYLYQGTVTSDQRVNATFHSTGSGNVYGGLLLRADNTRSGYVLIIDAAEIRIEELASGVGTQRGSSFSITPFQGQQFEFEIYELGGDHFIIARVEETSGAGLTEAINVNLGATPTHTTGKPGIRHGHEGSANTFNYSYVGFGDVAATTTSLTFTYSLSGAPAGVTINSSTGLITGPATAEGSGTARITATDQFAVDHEDDFAWSSAYRTQAVSGADLDFSFTNGIAITPVDLVQNWTANGNTLTYVSVSPALPTGLSINSSGVLSGTPTADAADATYTLTMEDEYSRQTTDTFTLEVSTDSTAPTFNSASYSPPNLTLDIVEASGAATVVWATADPAEDPTYTIAGGWVGTTYETGSFSTTSGENTDNISLTATTPEGSRELTLYAYDASDNLSLVERVAFTMPDSTAPTLSAPVDAANGATAATGSVDTNEGNGTLYWVVSTSATAPTAAQVKAGNDHTGSAAADSGSQAVSGTGTQTLSPAPSELTGSTTYYIHFMHEDAATNQSAVSSGDGFTTAAGGAFTPADLFTGSEAGFWYDPSDLTTLWTDTAGTTAATVGDAVARMDDKSGNGHHLKQATAGDRPILRQDANSKYYLEWNAAGDKLLPDTTIARPSGELTSVFAFQYTGGNIAVTPDSASPAGHVLQRFSANLYVSGDTDKLYEYAIGTGGNTGHTTTAPMCFRTTCFGTTAPTLRLNGTVWTDDGSPVTRAFGANFAQVAASASVVNNFYGQVLIQSSNITSTEAADLEEWMADKAGVTLA